MCVCGCECVCAHRFHLCARYCVCVRCWVKPLIEKQATVATCLAVFPSICLEQHGASVRIREGGEEEATERRLPFISASSHSLSLFSLFGRQHWSLKRPSLSLLLSSQCEFFCLPSSASQRRVISQHDVLCCEFSTRHASSPPLPLHRHHFFETHCATLSKYWR